MFDRRDFVFDIDRAQDRIPGTKSPGGSERREGRRGRDSTRNQAARPRLIHQSITENGRENTHKYTK